MDYQNDNYNGQPQGYPQQPQGYPQPPQQYGYTPYPQQPYQPTPQRQRPTSNLSTAILTTIFCCVPFGIPAIVYAARTNALWEQGDYEGAEYAAEQSKKWSNRAFTWGLILGILYFVANLLFIMGGSGAFR